MTKHYLNLREILELKINPPMHWEASKDITLDLQRKLESRSTFGSFIITQKRNDTLFYLSCTQHHSSFLDAKTGHVPVRAYEEIPTPFPHKSIEDAKHTARQLNAQFAGYVLTALLKERDHGFKDCLQYLRYLQPMHEKVIKRAKRFNLLNDSDTKELEMPNTNIKTFLNKYKDM